ncbi:MAG: phosphatidylserine decarboxylase [Candidatus Aminicenantales bacterium]
MIGKILLSSVGLSLFIILPLSIKWQFPLGISVRSSLFIGIFSGIVVSGIAKISGLKYVPSLILQLILILGIFAAFIAWKFNRNPERIPPEDKNCILSPADGKVIYIKRFENGSIPYSEKKGKGYSLLDFIQTDILPTEGYLIGVSQTFLDVHVNRSPIDGQVTFIRHIKGNFISLKREEAVVLNERALTVINNERFKVGVIQIASRLVRQIVIDFREGQKVRRGERLGMIRFGSQVDLILPNWPSIKIEAKPGDYVKAGSSVVARICRGPDAR